MVLYIGSQKCGGVNVKTECTLQTKTVTPSANNQTIYPDGNYDGLSSVTVNGDSNLIANNIANGKTIFGVTGTATIATLQTKTVTPSASSKTIYPDSGYNGLRYVTVQGDSNLKASNIVNGVKIFGVTGTATTGSGSSATMYSGKITTQYTTYTVYYSNGSSVTSFDLTGSKTFSVPANSIIAVYSPWGDTSVGTLTNANQVLVTYTCDCGETMGLFTVTGNNFVINMY